MRRFVHKVIPFIVIALAVAGIRYWVNVDKRSKCYFNAITIDTGLVIIGDSKSLAGFDESVLDGHTGLKSYNLSIWGARPLNNLRLVDEVHIRNSIVFLVVSSRIFLSLDSIDRSKVQNIEKIFNFNLYDKVKGFVKHNKEGRWEYTRQKNGGITLINKTRYYAPYSRYNDSLSYCEKIRSPKLDYFVDVKIGHVIEIIKKLLVNNNQLYLVDLPDRASYLGWVKNEEDRLFGKLTTKTGMGIIDFGIYPDSFFYDSHHLNRIGARRFTEDFCKRFDTAIAR